MQIPWPWPLRSKFYSVTKLTAPHFIPNPIFQNPNSKKYLYYRYRYINTININTHPSPFKKKKQQPTTPSTRSWLRCARRAVQLPPDPPRWKYWWRRIAPAPWTGSPPWSLECAICRVHVYLHLYIYIYTQYVYIYIYYRYRYRYINIIDVYTVYIYNYICVYIYTIL